MENFYPDYFHQRGEGFQDEDISEELAYQTSAALAGAPPRNVRAPAPTPTKAPLFAVAPAVASTPAPTPAAAPMQRVEGMQNAHVYNGIVISYKHLLFFMFVMIVVLVVDNMCIRRELRDLACVVKGPAVKPA